MLLTASDRLSSYTHAHEATRCRFQQKGTTTMTNLQTNQIETLSDAELDNVAGGFSLSILKAQVHFIGNLAHHPIDNAGQIAKTSVAALKNILPGWF
jgi:hypothetical protein